MLGESRAWGQSQSPVTIEAGGQEATILADQILQVGGSNDLMIAVGNVEITQGRTRLLADRVEIQTPRELFRYVGNAVAYEVTPDGQRRLTTETRMGVRLTSV